MKKTFKSKPRAAVMTDKRVYTKLVSSIDTTIPVRFNRELIPSSSLPLLQLPRSRFATQYAVIRDLVNADKIPVSPQIMNKLRVIKDHFISVMMNETLVHSITLKFADVVIKIDDIHPVWKKSSKSSFDVLARVTTQTAVKICLLEHVYFLICSRSVLSDIQNKSVDIQIDFTKLEKKVKNKTNDHGRKLC